MGTAALVMELEGRDKNEQCIGRCCTQVRIEPQFRLLRARQLDIRHAITGLNSLAPQMGISLLASKLTEAIVDPNAGQDSSSESLDGGKRCQVMLNDIDSCFQPGISQ